MVLDSIRVHFFQFQILIGEKMSLFLEISLRKDILILGEGPRQGLSKNEFKKLILKLVRVIFPVI